MDLCRTRQLRMIPQTLFNLLTCSTCFQYLFPKNSELQSKGIYLEATGYSKYKKGTKIIPDITNSSFVNSICKALETERDCDRWTACCHAAISCCQTQLNTPQLYNGTKFCPRIWDGYGCFGDTLPGVRELIQCPSYIEHGVTHANALKDCTENGTWYVDPVSNLTWTDYTACIPIQDPRVLVYVSLACNILSLLLLVPSCAIFLAFKQLRSQHRIKLHICFFTSLYLYRLLPLCGTFLFTTIE